MDIQINAASGIPLYEQISEQIKQLILAGELSDGSLLPSVRILAQQLGVSVITTRRAYTELEQEGYVITTPAKGTFVSHRYNERLRELGYIRLSELIDDLIYLAIALEIEPQQLSELLGEHYQYVMENPDGQSKLASFTKDNLNLKRKLMQQLRQRGPRF